MILEADQHNKCTYVDSHDQLNAWLIGHACTNVIKSRPALLFTESKFLNGTKEKPLQRIVWIFFIEDCFEISVSGTKLKNAIFAHHVLINQ